MASLAPLDIKALTSSRGASGRPRSEGKEEEEEEMGLGLDDPARREIKGFFLRPPNLLKLLVRQIVVSSSELPFLFVTLR